MKWQAFEYDGDTFDLSHVDSFDHTFIVDIDGKEHRFSCNVIISDHVFSKEPTSETDPALIYRWGNPKYPREFDFERYELSKQLPELIRLFGDKVCKHTGKNNFLRIEVLNRDGVKQNYEIYFTVRQSSSGWLSVIIESAYVRDLKEISEQKKRRYRNIRFALIARNTAMGKAIKMPPK